MDGILPGYPAPSSGGASPRRLMADKPNLEARWVLAAQAGYTLAFDELVARNQDRIYRLAAMHNELPYCADNPHERDTQAELGQLAAATTNILKPTCRVIFFLCDVEKWSVDETADFLGLPVSAVTTSLPRTRQEISQHLNPHSTELNHLLPRWSAPPGGSSKEINHERTISSTAP